MPPTPGSAHAAAVRAARRASAVFKAVVQGPQAPAPAAWGVEINEFRTALPWLSWRELVTFANHFGQRGTVREEIAAELASEIRRRMCPGDAAPVLAQAAERQGRRKGAGDSQEGGKAAGGLSDAARAMASRSALDPREVAAVVYSFSKLVPQTPEYLPIYAGVALGIQRGAWKFSRLQAALVGTALADVGHHLTDALPAVLRPVLRRLCEDAAERTEVTVDELRYLAHACTMLPRPGLEADEMEVLAGLTKQLAGQATFATAAHLTVSWLQLRPPPAAKRAHQEALRAAGAQLYGQTPSNPAHPLPAAGLAPAVADLLARERERVPPPLTPPQFRDIVEALMQISRGLRSEAACRSRSLSVGDWTEIAWLITEFCEAHDTASLAEEGLGAVRPLPGWAASALGFVFSRAHQHTPHGPAAADLDTVLSLFRLLRRYRPMSPPGRAFFAWARQRVLEHYEAGGADPAKLAEAVSELVPRLPEDERTQLAQLLLVGAHAPASHSVRPALLARARSQAAAWPASARLLGSEGRAAAAAAAPGISLAAAPAGAAAAAVGRRAASKGLWGLLAQEAPSGVADASAAPVFQHRGAAAEAGEAAAMVLAAHSEGAAAALAEDVAAPSAPAAMPATPAPPQPESSHVRELRERLERALERVEALEVRLEESEQRRAAAGPDAMELGAVGQGPGFNSWEPATIFPGDIGGAIGTMPGTAAHAVAGGGHVAAAMHSPATTHLHRPFKFEQFRRANSQKLQSERLRVLVPPDHYPMWPLIKK